MGQEFLEDKQWNWDPNDIAHLIWWGGLNQLLGAIDQAMVDHLRFTQDSNPAALESARTARRKRQRIPRPRPEPRHRLSTLAGRHRPRRHRRRHAGRNDVVQLRRRLPVSRRRGRKSSTSDVYDNFPIPRLPAMTAPSPPTALHSTASTPQPASPSPPTAW